MKAVWGGLVGSLSTCLTHQALNVALVLYHEQWLHVKPDPLTWADIFISWTP